MLPRLLLLGLIACSLVSAEYYTPKQADKDFLLKQKKVYNLLYHISQPAFVNKALYEEGQAWDIEANINSYANTDAVKEFLYMYKNGMLGRGELFSLYYPNLLKELKSLFRLFYYANDFDTFFKTASWARNNMNEAEFFFALYNAVLMRPDTKFIQLPPPYEIYPYLFFNSEVLQKARYPALFGQPVSDPQAPGMYTSYILTANYSGWYLNREDDMENKLNYFTEDIGLNTFYFFFRLGLPFWLESKEFNLPMSSRGVEYLYGHKLLLNRYYLERFSNDLPRIEDFDWQKKFYPGYYPTMSFHNGLPLPQRPSWSDIPFYKYKYVQDIMEKESRISAVIDYGYISKLGNESKWQNIYDEDGLNIIGNLIEGNADSYVPDYYGSIDSLGRKILGFNLEPTSKYQIYPSALETFFSSMRDPAFYRLYKRIISYYYRYKQREAPYRKDEIIYPNLKIESFAIDKLITYFDKFDTSVSNGLLIDKMKENEKMPLVKIRQYRLNHKPFNFHITVNSDKSMKAAIRIFLGPKYDAHRKLPDFPESLKYFYEMDNWIVDLNSGLNKIVRNSRDSCFAVPDQEPSETFYNNLEMSLSEGKPFTYYERVYGFPQRLLLPKGKKEGMPIQFFIYISPVITEYQYSSRLWGELKLDGRPFGFPLDKLLYDYNYDGSNMIFKDILIYHKDEFDMNIAY